MEGLAVLCSLRILLIIMPSQTQKGKHVGIVENVTNFIFSEALKW